MDGLREVVNMERIYYFEGRFIAYEAQHLGDEVSLVHGSPVRFGYLSKGQEQMGPDGKVQGIFWSVHRVVHQDAEERLYTFSEDQRPYAIRALTRIEARVILATINTREAKIMPVHQLAMSALYLLKSDVQKKG